MSLKRMALLAQVVSAIVVLTPSLNCASNSSQPEVLTLPEGFSIALAPMSLQPAHLINDSGQIAGTESTSTGSTHAAVWRIHGDKLIDLGTLPAPYNAASAATAINNVGVVGYSTSASAGTHAFLWEGNLNSGHGTMTDLGTLPAPYNVSCVPAALNNWGQVVGNCGAHAFLWSRNPSTREGTMIDLGTPPAPFNLAFMATAINGFGEVVGNSFRHDIPLTCCPLWGGPVPNAHAFLWKNGVLSDLSQGNPGAVSMAFDINDLGQVAGFAGGGGIAAVVWQNGTQASLQNSDAHSLAYGINTMGEVVGELGEFNTGPTLTVDGVLWHNGSMTDLQPPLNLPLNSVFLGGPDQVLLKSYISARAINNSGQILGVAIGGATGVTMLLWSKVP